jgi:signal peptidase II
LREDDRTTGKTTGFYLTAGVVLAVDQLAKILARAYLQEGQTHTLIPGLFDLKLSYNTGAAFGILPDWAPLFVVAALVTIFAVVRFGQARERSRAFVIGLGLLLGGAMGNLIDRIAAPSRGVTDFLSFHVRIGGSTYAWPTFNVADVAIVAGAILVLFHVFILDRQRTTTND